MWELLKVKASAGRQSRRKVASGVTNAASISGDRCRLHRLDNPISSDGTKEEAYAVDIIAIHGLNGDPYRTWTHENRRLWLAEFLPQSLPGSRVYSFGYDSAVFFSRSTSDVGDFARSLLAEIVLTREHTKENTHRPIVFICHSLGGIVCKKSLIIAHEESRYGDILLSTKAVVFLGTPHGGSEKASLGSVAATVLNAVESISLLELALGRTRSDLVKMLRSRSPILEEVSLSFRNRVDDMEIVSFYETRALAPFKSEIVPRVSATIGVKNEELIPIFRDHRSICRFEDEHDSAYRKIVQLCRNHAKPNVQRKLDGREREFLTSLNISFIDDVRAALPKRVAGTCEWILSDPQFRQWCLVQRSGTLWVCGDAGCGKTALMSFLVDQLGTQMSKALSESGAPQLPILVCYFFCDDKDADRKDAAGILRSLLFQVFFQRHDLVRHAEPLFSTVNSGRAISFSRLWQVLEAVLNDPNTGYVGIIIDALDECEKGTRHLLVDALYGYMAQDRGSAASIGKIILSSRPLVSITDKINPKSAILRLWERGRRNMIMRDVGLVIKDHIQQLMLRTKASEETKIILETKLAEKASGTFLWVVLVLSRLVDSFYSSPADLERIVREIPPNLDSLYHTILAEIEQGPDRGFAVKALQIIVGAFRPLSIAEFRYAIAIQPGHLTLHDVEMTSEPDLQRTLRGVLGPLVHIFESRVYLVHQSAKDFLIKYSSVSNQQHGSSLAFNMEATSDLLSISCITFLSLADFAEETFLNENMVGFREMPGMLEEIDPPLQQNDFASPFASPQLSENPASTLLKDGTPAFFEYASLYWAKHFASCPNTASGELVEAAIALSERSSTNLDNWSERFRRLSTNSVILPPALDPFLVAAYFGHIHVIEYLLRHQCDQPSWVLADQTLTWAARMGHCDVVSCLLAFEANMSGAPVEGSSPLCWASRNGHARVVSLLLAKGESSQINSPDYEARTPLSLAVGNGHLAVTKLLLAFPNIVVDQPSRRGWTPLFWGLGGDSDQLGLNNFRLLVSDGRADLNRRDQSGRTVLSWAAEFGALAVVKFLLNHEEPAVEGLLNDVADKIGRSPLSWAAYHGQITVVEALCLSGRIDLQLQSVDHQGRNAISLAAERNHWDILKILTQYDADGVDRPDKDGQTPLSWAMWGDPCNVRNVRTVRTLLQTGLVNVDSKANNGRTPLSFAAAAGRPDLIRILVEEGGANLDTISDSDLTVDWRSPRVKYEIYLLKQEIAD